MLKVRQYGESSKVTSVLVRHALTFFTERLMSKRLCSNITVRVVFKKGMIKDTGLEATCLWDDDNLKPREFTITVDSDLSRRKLLLSLAHEVVHIKQYATGQLRYFLRGPNCKWMGKAYDDTGVAYDELPWEVEAWNYENLLYREFLDERKKVSA